MTVSLDTGGATSSSAGCDLTPVHAGRLRRLVRIGQRIMVICNTIISTAMRTMSVAYTRSTGSCVVMQMSISTRVFVLYSEKSISGICAVIEKSISDIYSVIEKSISTHCLVCWSLSLITGFAWIAVGGEQKPGDQCLVAIAFFVVFDCFFPELVGYLCIFPELVGCL